MSVFWFIAIAAVAALFFCGYLARAALRHVVEAENVAGLSRAIENASHAYLQREHRILIIIGFFLAALVLAFFGWRATVGFVVGASASAAAAYVAMGVTLKTNSRVADRALSSKPGAFYIALEGAGAASLTVVSMALLSVSGMYMAFPQRVDALVGLAFGASLLAVFTRMGGGIFTKAADIAADVVGKLQEGMGQDDARNPALLADLVGDNVGNSAASAADMFQSLVLVMVAALLVGSFLLPGFTGLLALSLLLVLAGLIATAASIMLIKMSTTFSVLRNLYLTVISASIISGLLALPMLRWALGDVPQFNILALYGCVGIGFALSGLTFFITHYYTSRRYLPVFRIVQAAKNGHAAMTVSGLSVGMESVALPALFLAIAIISSLLLGGLFGIAMMAAGFCALAATILTLDLFGPLTDTASGVLALAGATSAASGAAPALREGEQELGQRNMRSLHEAGAAAKAVAKGYGLLASALASFIALIAFGEFTKLQDAQRIFEVTDPRVLIGVVLGGSIVYLFSSALLAGVSRSSARVIDEVRLQLRERKGSSRRENPDYMRAVNIVSSSALREMTYPAMLVLVTPLLVGLIARAEALAGFVVGALACGLLTAFAFTTAGSAWDSAKRSIETQGSGATPQERSVAVSADMVGDPLKDAVGLSMNPLMKTVAILALLLASLV